MFDSPAYIVKLEIEFRPGVAYVGVSENGGPQWIVPPGGMAHFGHPSGEATWYLTDTPPRGQEQPLGWKERLWMIWRILRTGYWFEPSEA